VSQASKILIIDDDWGTCEMISDVLRLKGYSVETAGLGQEGLEMLRSRPFNAAIVDIKLPDISGVDLLWVMKEASPGIEVIFITGHASLTSAIQAVSGNAFAYLTKPFETNHLLTTLDKALEKQRLATENQRLYQATMQELAERKRVEEQLKQSNVELARSEKALRKSLSDLKESHEELKEAQLQLIQAEKLESVSSLAAGVAHEVKNPLAIILQGLNYLSKRLPTDGDNAAIAIHDMEDAVKRADSVVKRLLDFSATSELSLATEELNSVVEQSLLLVKHELDKYHVNVVRELSESLPPVKLVRNKIEQVFINIFLNAIHAMPKGGTLTVKTYAKQLTEAKHNVGSREADHFRIGETVVMAEVEDTGTGIPNDHLAEIFDPFFTTKATGKGTGLGLTVTKKIIDLHGGTIDIGNRQGGGVKVTIMFKARGGNEHE
jgi:signal transduction histidine kinase